MKILAFTGLLALLLLTGCAGSGIGESGGGSAPLNMNFYQHWVHSFEEQNGQKIPNIFRPKGSREFPPSRFRMEFAFDKSGQCNYKYLSPVDAHEMRDCVYTKIGNKVYLYDQAGQLLSHLSFTLLEPAQKDQMRMTYGVQQPSATKAGAKSAAKKDAKSE